MTIYDYMTPFNDDLDEGQNIPQRPALQLATPATSPVKANRLDDDCNQENDRHWQRNYKPDSPQSLLCLDHSSPKSEYFAKSPKCSTCGLVTKRSCICGHMSSDILEDNCCPDIDAPDLSGEHNPNLSPTRKSTLRRHSSLSKPPIFARDQSTYEEEKANSNANTKNKSWELPAHHVPLDVEGDIDRDKQLRVEKAMEQILFGNAKVSEHTRLEQRQRLRAMSINEGSPIAIDNQCDADWRKQCRVDKARAQILFGNAKVSAHTHTKREETQKLRSMSITEGITDGITTTGEGDVGFDRFTAVAREQT